MIEQIIGNPSEFLKDPKKLEMINVFVMSGVTDIEISLLKQTKEKRPENSIFVGTIFPAKNKQGEETLYIRFGYIKKDFTPIKYIAYYEVLPFLAGKLSGVIDKNKSIVSMIQKNAGEMVSKIEEDANNKEEKRQFGA